MKQHDQREIIFAQARVEKRKVFQKCWNSFLKSRGVLAAIILFAVSQLLLLFTMPGFIKKIGFFIGILHEGYPIWCNWVIVGISLAISTPGICACWGMFRLRREGEWPEEGNPRLAGLMMMRRSNLIIWVTGGVALLLYPTAIIGSGQILPEESIIKVFYIFLAITLLFVISVVLLRPVLQRMEENVACCWADMSFVLLLLIVLPLAAVLVLLIANMTWLPSLVLLVTVFSVEVPVFLYWRFLQSTQDLLYQIDQKALSVQNDPDDPYQRY